MFIYRSHDNKALYVKQEKQELRKCEVCGGIDKLIGEFKTGKEFIIAFRKEIDIERYDGYGCSGYSIRYLFSEIVARSFDDFLYIADFIAFCNAVKELDKAGMITKTSTEKQREKVSGRGCSNCKHKDALLYSEPCYHCVRCSPDKWEPID